MAGQPLSVTRVVRPGPAWLEPALQVLRARYFAGPAPQAWGERDWSRATGAALAERLGPALGEAAAACGVELPRPCWAALAAARLECRRRALDQERLLDELAPALHERGIAAAVFKGLALSRFYPDPHLRQAADIDLLVPPRQLAPLEALMREAGFEHRAGGGGAVARYAVTYARGSNGGEEATLDLHPSWHEVSLDGESDTVCVGGWQERLDRARLGEHSWRVLPPAMELYLTAAHSVLSSFRTLSLYLDLAVLASRLDPQTAARVTQAARVSGRQRHLRHALTLASQLFAVEVAPGHVSLPARLGVPLSLRIGYLGWGVRFLPSALLMELLLVRGVKRKLQFASWVLGHQGPEEQGTRSTPPGRRAWKIVRGFRWLGGTVLRYRAPGSATLR